MRRRHLVPRVGSARRGALAAPPPAQYKSRVQEEPRGGPTGPWGEVAAEFADLLKARTHGRISVKNDHLFAANIARPSFDEIPVGGLIPYIRRGWAQANWPEYCPFSQPVGG